MSTVGYFKTLSQIEDRVTAKMTELRQAERDVALHCGGMAFDGVSAEEIYRAGLESVGVPKRDTYGMSAPQLRILLRNLPRSGSGGSVTSSAAGMAHDSSPSVLDKILQGVRRPRDLSNRNDFRR
jgi:hypothetical protein